MKLNISIDDVSPHPFSSVSVIEKCNELIDVFPDIKFTLFVPISYWRTVKFGTTTTEPLDISKDPKFCEELLDLNPKNFEIGYHGFFHGIPHQSDNDEFKNISKDLALEKSRLMKETVAKAGLQDLFKPIFRPPAWRMCPSAFEALAETGFELFALTDVDYALESYKGSEKIYKSVFSNVFPPFADLEYKDSCGVVYHACEWDKNFLTSDKVESLIRFIKDSEEEVEFVFVGGL